MALKPCLDVTAARAAIYLVDDATPGDDAPLNAPLAHLSHILWHSDLDYFEASKQLATLSLPARSANYGAGGQTADHTISGLVRDATKHFALIAFNQWFAYSIRLQTGFSDIGTFYRELTPISTNSGALVVRETWYRDGPFYNSTLPDWPPITVDLQLVQFAPRPAVVGSPMVDLDPLNGRIQLGKGKLDTSSAGFLRVVPTATGLAFTTGRTIDSAPGAAREWKSDGTTLDHFGTYTGGYAGPVLTHVAI